MVLHADVEGNITACDEGALAGFDRNPSEVFGRPIAAFLTGESASEAQSLQQSILASVSNLADIIVLSAVRLETINTSARSSQSPCFATVARFRQES